MLYNERDNSIYINILVNSYIINNTNMVYFNTDKKDI